MTQPGTEANAITPEPPQSPRATRGAEHGEVTPTLRTPQRPPNSLPLELSSFVGREKELAEVKRLLENNRLLTLTGPGGAGKTRLALAAASETLGGFRDGVRWVGLAPISDPDLVPQVVALSALGVRKQPDRPLLDTLIEELLQRQLLLGMDSCEHLIGACAALTDRLLRACPDLKILATSREALAVAGEMTWPVPPLSLPDSHHPPPYEDLRSYEAVKLFSERAKAAGASFKLDQNNASAVVRVCQKLEGLPLAIELAAARVRVLSVGQIAARLDESFGLLKSQSRTADPRQRTLRTTMDWSHELLSEQERVLFRRLSVFAGGWRLEAAEEVCTGAGVEEDEVLDLLTCLVDKSLVLVTEQGAETRYRILETIRQYGTERLEDSGEGQEVRRRHAGYFLALAEGLEAAMWGTEEAAWLGLLEVEHNNLRAALSWSIEQDTELGLRLAGALRWFWYWLGHYGEGRGWLVKALAKGSPGAEVGTRAKALHALGWLAHDQGDLGRAETAAQEGIDLSEKAEGEDNLAASFRNLLGEAARHRGDYRRATALLEEGTAIYRETGDKRGTAWGLFLLGNTAALQGEHKRATALFEEGLVLSRELGGAQPLGDYLSRLGYERLLEGDHELAAALSEEAAALLRDQGYRGGLQFALNSLGWVALVRDDRERARALHREGLLLCRELGDRLIASECIEGLACAGGAQGEVERAARMFGAAQALREAAGHQRAPRGTALRDPFLQDARSGLAVAEWDEAFAEGRAMSLAEALEYALESEKPREFSPSLSHPGGLSAREAEVLRLVARGLTNARVAQELYISPRTVDRHLNSVYRKLGVSSRAAAARFAAKSGLA